LRTTALAIAAAVVLDFAVFATTAVSGFSRVIAEQKPRASPHERVSGTVGGSTITVTYGRPYMKGRKIFGGLVPYERVWCPGADEATVLDSSRDLQIGDLKVPAGPHTIWILPTENEWTLIVSKEESGFHTRYHPELDLGRIAVQKTPLPAPIEQLTFEFRETDAKSGVLAMKWETTEVSVPLRILE
jgi:hypothetical protein